MLNLPFSKLKIKIHALDNPTSVFKKRNLLSLNCINKSSPKKKNITPIRTNPNDIPHYMLPIKSNMTQNNQNNQINQNNQNNYYYKTFNNNKNSHIRPSPPFNNKKVKKKDRNSHMNDSRIKLPNLTREKSDKIIYSKININKINGTSINSFKKNQDISMPNINNSFNNFKLNDKNNISDNNWNSNMDFIYNKKKNSLMSNINNYSNYQNIINDTNNEILLTEQNINNPSNNNNFSSDYVYEKNIPKQFQSIFSEMQKKINEQNKLLSDRIKEIENLKKEIEDKEKNELKYNNFNNSENMIDINEYKNENELLNKEIERYKSLLDDYKKNNQEKNQQNELNCVMIEKLQKELKNLKENIESLSSKYQSELSNNKILEEKYKYIKNNIYTPQELTEKYENRIIQQEKMIANLEEELYQIKTKKKIIKKSKIQSLEILGTPNNANSENNETITNKDKLSRTLTREFIVKIEVVDGKMSSNNGISNNNIINNNEDGNENIIIDSPSKKFILSSKNSNSSLHFCLNDNKLILSDKMYNKIQLLLNILLIINGINEEIFNDKINQIQNKKNDNQINIIINDFCQNIKVLNKQLIKQFINDYLIKDKKGENALKNLFKYNKENINEKNNFSNYKQLIKEKCLIYDYKDKKTIPFNYFKHIYKEICYNKNISFSEIEFFNIIYECKQQNNNNSYSIFDIFYENLISEENINNNNKDKDKNKNDNENENISDNINENEINTTLINNNENNNNVSDNKEINNKEINNKENNNNIINNNIINNNEINNNEINNNESNNNISDNNISDINNINNNESNNNEISNNEISNNESNNNLINNNDNYINKDNYKFDFPRELKYKDLIQNFLDKVIKEAIEKQKDDNDSLVKAKSYDQDLFSKLILQNDNNVSKMNKSSSDGEDNDFEI